jgi:hypothetical protein
MSKRKVKSNTKKQQRKAQKHKRQQAQATKQYVARATKTDAQRDPNRQPLQVATDGSAQGPSGFPPVVYGRGVTTAINGQYEFARLRLQVRQEGRATDALYDEARAVVEEYLAREDARRAQQDRADQPYPYLTGHNIQVELLYGLTLRSSNARTAVAGEKTTDWVDVGLGEVVPPGTLIGPVLEDLAQRVTQRLAAEVAGLHRKDE